MKLSELDFVKCSVCFADSSKIIARGTDYLYGTTSKIFTWVECNLCKHLYLNPRPGLVDLPIIYPSNLLNYRINSKAIAWRVKSALDKHALKKLAKGLKISRVLDIGCADGTLLENIRNVLGTNVILEGTELNSNATANNTSAYIKFHYGQIQNLGLKQNAYDLIFMQQVVEHLIDPEGDLSVIVSLLSQNGVLIIETPNQDSWDQKFFSKLNPGTWEGFHIPRHFNIWNNEGFKTLIERSGGQITKILIRPKPVHWTVSFQNLMKSTGKKNFAHFFSLRNIPLLVFFYFIDLLQIFFGHSSDVRYYVKKR